LSFLSALAGSINQHYRVQLRSYITEPVPALSSEQIDAKEWVRERERQV
jgi:hypothetical protein